MSAALGLFLLSSLSLPTTGCGAFGLTYSLTGLTVEPNAACIAQGSTAQFTAYGTYTEGGHSAKTQDITDQVNWSSDLTEVASINASGLATSGTSYIGLTNIEASTQGEFGVLDSYASLTVKNDCVSDSTVPAIQVVPAVATLKTIGDTEQPLAIGILPAGHGTVDLSSKVTWVSSDLAVATVDPNGVIRAVGPGTAVITAHETTPDGRVLAATQTVTFQAAQNQ